ncbi:uncharacterized protein [Rhodnius prolixus]|uniref:Uncharacterized protein n=1 Tax=Rhodnius prolixus TaxID=13249 RepID=T1HZ98_RHOPR
MANTVCIVLVATLFVVGNAVLYDVDHIYKKDSEAKATLNREVGLAVKRAELQATTPEERKCLGKVSGKVFAECNAELNEVTKKLVNVAHSKSSDLSNSPAALHKAVDGEYNRVVHACLHDKLAELKNC